ncbi:UPF0235 protein C15orf40 homolog isoform X2 [Daktulosphaira vitifoliae]|nr:UPF0235 protein C15orf40 homolog isoform X2 [Daktulosphaira vitifoliae]XP_050542825.1 UPF0235 protein C15orf40 homolog isoform X2 [Daktulosphaira vitifoliae]
MAPKKPNKHIIKEKSETETVGPILLAKSGNIIIKINAKPGAKSNNITDISPDGIGVQINAPPTDGEANTELIKYLSKVLNLRKSDMLIDRGSKSRSKTILVNGTQDNIENFMNKIKKEIEERK